MKINSINQQQNTNFAGKNPSKVGKYIQKAYNKVTSTLVEKPVLVGALAGSSVVAQKIVMSGSEAVIGPAMDVGIGEVITKATGETDGRTRESSKVQAIRTFSQSVGGTIIGVIIRLLCIGATTALFSKFGEKAGGKIGKMIAEIVNEKGLTKAAQPYDYKDNMEKWGKSVGGVAATLIMLVTNFIIDAPFINWINKKATDVVDKFDKNKEQKIQEKEVK